jgi:hypothetical protein
MYSANGEEYLFQRKITKKYSLYLPEIRITNGWGRFRQPVLPGKAELIAVAGGSLSLLPTCPGIDGECAVVSLSSLRQKKRRRLVGAPPA